VCPSCGSVLLDFAEGFGYNCRDTLSYSLRLIRLRQFRRDLAGETSARPTRVWKARSDPLGGEQSIGTRNNCHLTGYLSSLTGPSLRRYDAAADWTGY